MAGRQGVSHYSSLREPGTGPKTTDAAAIKAEFARRLEAARVRRGWSQSELARRASDHLPKPARGQKQGKAIGRDAISHYSRGIMLPRPEFLSAIAKALGLPAGDLMPAAAPSVGSALPALNMQTLSDGRVQLMVNRTVTMSTATKIVNLLSAEDA